MSNLAQGPTSAHDISARDIATPETRPGFVTNLVQEQWLQSLAARVGAWIGARVSRPIRVGNNVLAMTHAHVSELLSRDLEFRIGPVNADEWYSAPNSRLAPSGSRADPSSVIEAARPGAWWVWAAPPSRPNAPHLTLNGY